MRLSFRITSFSILVQCDLLWGLSFVIGNVFIIVVGVLSVYGSVCGDFIVFCDY